MKFSILSFFLILKVDILESLVIFMKIPNVIDNDIFERREKGLTKKFDGEMY